MCTEHISSSVEWSNRLLLVLSPSCSGSCQPAGSPTKVGPTSFRGEQGRICWPCLCVHPQELPSPLPPRKDQWHLHPHTRKPKQLPLAPDLVLKPLILVQGRSEAHTQLTLTRAHTHTPVHTDDNGNPNRLLLSEMSQPRLPNRGVHPATWAPALWSHHVLTAAEEATCGEGAVTGGRPYQDQLQSSCPCTAV